MASREFNFVVLISIIKLTWSFFLYYNILEDFDQCIHSIGFNDGPINILVMGHDSIIQTKQPFSK